MSKASEAKLAELHGVVAETLTKVIQVDEPSAAHIMAAITFLKNNSITADPESNSDLQAFTKALGEKRAQQKGKLSQSLLATAADQFERDLGEGLFQ